MSSHAASPSNPGNRFQTIVEVKHALKEAAAVPVRNNRRLRCCHSPISARTKRTNTSATAWREDILNALVKVPGLRVPARTSSLAFRGREQDIRTIAQALNVEHILEGSVRKARESPPRDRPVDQGVGRIPPLVGTLRPRSHRCVRDSGRNIARHRGSPETQAERATAAEPAPPRIWRPTTFTSGDGISRAD